MKTVWAIKRFDELTLRELHDLYTLRTRVFIVEQNCVYDEIDGKDPVAIHILCHGPTEDLVAYARILPPDDDGLPHVGRVVIRKDHRGTGLSTELMDRTLAALRSHFGSARSALAAQSPLESFYGRFGYSRTGPDYDWEGIMHVDMAREKDL